MLGTDNSLDFGMIKVSEEVKLSVNLKNKGKHDIAYKYVHTHILYISMQYIQYYNFSRNKNTIKCSEANVQ